MSASDHHGDFIDRSEPVLAVSIIMVALCSVFVFFRILSRAVMVNKVSWDDYFIVLAWMLAVGLSVAICYGAAYGLGRHEDDIPSGWQSGLRKAIYAFTILYHPALMATKTSILAFYLNFSKANRTFKWACYITGFVVIAGGLSLTLVTAFQCSPVSAAFKAVKPPNATCTDILTIYLASIPLNIITDLTLLFLPLPILTSMRLPRKQKIIVIVTFSFGIFVAIVDVVRISYLQSAAMMRLAEIANNIASDGPTRDAEADSSFYLAFSFMWSGVEVTVGIMVACVPGLKPLVARFIPAMLRDPNDPPSHIGSVSEPSSGMDKQVPPAPETAHRGSVSRTSQHQVKDEGDMGMMEFLTGRRDFAQSPRSENGPNGSGLEFITTPDMNEAGMQTLQRTQTALTNTTRHTRPDSPRFFDFVDMTQKKSFVHMTGKESIYPIVLVTILFFIWGFEYGLLDSLNMQFQTVANTTTGQNLGIRSAYYIGYFAGPLTVGRLVLQKWGFRACYPIGLSIYAAGCLILWPAAVLTSWPTIMVTNFLIGFGLSNLEVSANPFITLCGPLEYAEIRLNLSQGVQAIGSVVAPLIADRAFYHKALNAPSLITVQWAYLGIALATVVLALCYYYVPLPEATDAELEDAAERIDGANKVRIRGVRLTWLVLIFGIYGQFCYVGGQEVNSSSFYEYLAIVAPGYNQANYFAIAHTAFAVSRFLVAGLGFWVKPRILLLIFFCGAIVFNALCTHFTGSAGVALMICTFFCEGPQFALLFAMCLRGQGRNTRLASVLMTSAIGGGALFSPIASVLANEGSWGVQKSLWIAVVAFAGGSLVAFGGNLSTRVKRLVDPVSDMSTDHQADGEDQRPSSMSSAASRALSFLSVVKKGRKGDGAGLEHREMRGGGS